MNKLDFNDIRPYYDSEIPAAMQRIASSEHISKVIKFLKISSSETEIQCLLRQLQTINDFQVKIMLPIINQLVSLTTTGLTHSFTETLNNNKGYLFVSNHRDIVLDAMFLQHILYNNNLETCEITFGNNLMMNQLIIDIGKSNKMFKVERTTNTRRAIQISQHLSDYIRSRITYGTNIWIAQRNGRTKDGNDKTDHGLINMFTMSGSRQQIIDNICELNITPTAISYEIEPCALLKTREIFITRHNGKYSKKDGEDLNSIITGLTEQKGKVHIAIGKPITKYDLEAYQNLSRRELICKVEEIIDKQIRSNYKLNKNNYIAYDIAKSSDKYSSFYNEEEKNKFVEMLNCHLQELTSEFGQNAKSELSEILINIYANPVRNKYRNEKL